MSFAYVEQNRQKWFSLFICNFFGVFNDNFEEFHNICHHSMVSAYVVVAFSVGFPL